MSTTGYRLPGEWENQSGVLITWPPAQSDWAEDLSAIETLYINLCRAISKYEKLLIVVYDEALSKHVHALLSDNDISLANIIFHIAKTNDTWTRDYGPICLTDNNKTRLVDFQFNGWGDKFEAELDTKLTAVLLAANVLKPDESISTDFILEGGSIESDGNGSMMTTSSCLLTDTRNPNFTQNDIELYLQNTLGIKQILWLNHGYLSGDDTDSHVDVLARFTDQNTIAHVKCEDPADEHFDSSQAMEAQLKSFRNIEGKPYKLVALPFPAATYDEDKRRLPASYANFLIINNAVLVPTYNDANDEVALNLLQKCFKNRDIIGIPFNAAIKQNGSLHCLTMQLPSGIL